ncbi:MAG TPA: class I SAM-dependent DNA methyltransferase, partial [bacterium]|nr:class I SAM-dependent DNA methyltransferase [bacterium]
MSIGKSYTTLFNEKILKRTIDAFTFPKDLPAKHEIVERWVETLRSGVLGTTKELSLHGEFLQDIFRHVLGYRSITAAGGTAWELHPEKTVSPGGGQADGALGFFAPDSSAIHAPIELKGAMTDLDREMTRGYTPVDQGWRYMIETPECRWVIVSNYKETRLYHLNQTKRAFERFMLENLEDDASFRRFYFLLCRDNFMPAEPGGKSRVADLLDESARAQVEITDKLYRQYKNLRSRIFDHLTMTYPDRDPLFLLEKTQKILDRFLFVAFAEDRALLPRETIKEAFEHADPYNPRAKWKNFKAVFRWIDEGNAAMKFPAYNGGLFHFDPELDALELPDELIRTFAELSVYDFEEEVSVLVLGHIFEQSISDLEEMRLQAAEGKADSKAVSKRKREGVFYTPAFVTRYIVEQAVGRLLAEKQAAAFAKYEPEKQKSESKRLNLDYDVLLSYSLLDPP